LQHGLAIAAFFEGNNGNILVLRPGYYGLQYKSMHVSFIKVDHPDIVDVPVTVQVEIVYPCIRIIEHLFKFLRRSGLLEQFKRPFQTEVIARNLHLLCPCCCPTEYEDQQYGNPIYF
jgi:hypothetical protein